MFRSVVRIAVRSRAGAFQSVVRSGLCCVPGRPPDRVPEHSVISLVKAALTTYVWCTPSASPVVLVASPRSADAACSCGGPDQIGTCQETDEGQGDDPRQNLIQGPLMAFSCADLAAVIL